jgi:hypothetical protein
MSEAGFGQTLWPWLAREIEALDIKVKLSPQLLYQMPPSPGLANRMNSIK